MACFLGEKLRIYFPAKYSKLPNDYSGESSMFQLCLENYIVDNNLDPISMLKTLLKDEREAFTIKSNALLYYADKMDEYSMMMDQRFYGHLKCSESKNLVEQALKNIISNSGAFVSFEDLRASDFTLNINMARTRIHSSPNNRLNRVFFNPELEWLKAAFEGSEDIKNCMVYKNDYLLQYLKISGDKKVIGILKKYRQSVLSGKNLNETDLSKLLNMYMNIAPCPEIISFLIDKGCRVSKGLFLIHSIWDGDDSLIESNLAAFNGEGVLFDSNKFDVGDMKLVLMELRKCRTETFAIIFKNDNSNSFQESEKLSYVRKCIYEMDFERVSEVYGSEVRYWKEKMIDKTLSGNELLKSVVKALNEISADDWRTKLYRLDVKKKIFESLNED